MCVQEAGKSFRVCCAARDDAFPIKNAVPVPSCRLLELPDTQPPVFSVVTQACDQDTLIIEVTLDEPGTIFYVLTAAVPPISGFRPQDIFDLALPSGAAVVASGTLTFYEPGIPETFGFCNLDPSGVYTLLMVAQDTQEPPNQSLTVNSSPVEMLALCAAADAFQCTPETFLLSLQPRFEITGGPGLLTRQAVRVMSGTAGMSVYQVSLPACPLYLCCCPLVSCCSWL